MVKKNEVGKNPDNSQLLVAIADLATQVLELQESQKKSITCDVVEEKIAIVYRKFLHKIQEMQATDSEQYVTRLFLDAALTDFSDRLSVDKIHEDIGKVKKDCLFVFDEKDKQTAEIVDVFTIRSNLIEENTNIKVKKTDGKFKLVYFFSILNFLLAVLALCL